MPYDLWLNEVTQELKARRDDSIAGRPVRRAPRWEVKSHRRRNGFWDAVREFWAEVWDPIVQAL